MNDVRFANKYIRDKGTAKEIYRYWFFKQPIIILVYVMFGLWTISYILGSIIDPWFAFDNSYTLVIIIFCCFLMVLSYMSQVRMMVKRDEEMAGGRELLCETVVTDTKITTMSLGNENTLGFDGIRYAFITKEYIVLVTKARRVFIFKKDSFTIGDTESFVAFLKLKGIKVRGKKN